MKVYIYTHTHIIIYIYIYIYMCVCVLTHVNTIFCLTCLQAERVHFQCHPQCLWKRFGLAESTRVAGGSALDTTHRRLWWWKFVGWLDFSWFLNVDWRCGIVVAHGLWWLQKITFLGGHAEGSGIACHGSRCWWGSWRNNQMWSPAMPRSAPMARRLCGSYHSKLLRRWMHRGCLMGQSRVRWKNLQRCLCACMYN